MRSRRIVSRGTLRSVLLAGALLATMPGVAAPGLAVRQSAVTLYALNCLGCHLPPDEARRNAPHLVGQFAHTASGRIFFIRLPDPGAPPLDAADEAKLEREILNWKASCHVILQDAPLIRYGGARFVK